MSLRCLSQSPSSYVQEQQGLRCLSKTVVALNHGEPEASAEGEFVQFTETVSDAAGSYQQTVVKPRSTLP